MNGEFTDLLDRDQLERMNYARALVAYMNYDNDDPKYDGYRERETKDRYGINILNTLGKIYSKKPSDDPEFSFSRSTANLILAYMNYDNDDPKYDGYRQRESKETYAMRILESVCEANKDIDFDDPNVLFTIASQDIQINPKEKSL